jgi:hypothetical protein
MAELLFATVSASTPVASQQHPRRLNFRRFFSATETGAFRATIVCSEIEKRAPKAGVESYKEAP